MSARAAIFGCAGRDLSPRERTFFREANPWGFILFARNLDTPDQIRRLTAQLRETVGRAAPILIDQEGGRVQRLGPPLWRGWTPALTFAAHLPLAERAEAFRLRYRLLGSELAALGIDVNCAPLTDLARAQTHPILRNRCYAETPEEVAVLARATAEGLMEAGVLPVIKHLPGHGASVTDSHEALPHVDLDRASLESADFAAIRPLADLPMGMTAHIVYDGLGEDLPATQSARMIELIRNGLGFDGLLMTDDLSMKALVGPFGPRAASCLEAGCDVILHCNGDPVEMAAIAEATPLLARQAARRADAALAARRAPLPAEADLDARLAALIGDRAHA